MLDLGQTLRIVISDFHADHTLWRVVTLTCLLDMQRCYILMIIGTLYDEQPATNVRELRARRHHRLVQRLLGMIDE